MLTDITFNLTQNNQGFALVGNYGLCNIQFKGNFDGGKIVAYTGVYDKVIPFTADITPLKITNASIDLTKIPNGRRGHFYFKKDTPSYKKFPYPFVKLESDITNPSTDFVPKDPFSQEILKQINFTQNSAELEFVSQECVSQLQIKDLYPSYQDINNAQPVEIDTPRYLPVSQSIDRVTFYGVEGATNPNIVITIYDIYENHCLKIL